MKAWVKGLLIGQILFIIYAVIGTLWSNPPMNYEDIIAAFLSISFYTIIIGLYIDSIKLKWPSWIQGGFAGLIISLPIFIIGYLTYLYLASSIFNCITDGLSVSCPLSQGIIISILNLAIYFSVGALIGLIFGKRKSKKLVVKEK